MAPRALVSYLATRLALQFYPQNSTCKILRPYGASSIGYNFGHLHSRRIWSLVANLATKFKIWSSGGATCIGSNVVHRHQVGSHALPHCLELPYWHYQLVLSWYLHQPESHQLSLHKVSHSLSDGQTSGPKDRTPGLPGYDKNHTSNLKASVSFHLFLIGRTLDFLVNDFQACSHVLASHTIEPFQWQTEASLPWSESRGGGGQTRQPWQNN